jgi:hypothetical protein
MKSFFAGLFIALLLTGCASLNERKKERTLEQATMIYERSIRWGDFETATRFQRLDDAATRPTALPGNVSVTSYQQVNSRTLADGNEVKITVRIDYYNNDTLKVVTLTDEQAWKYYPDETAWYITTPLPAFR